MINPLELPEIQVLFKQMAEMHAGMLKFTVCNGDGSVAAAVIVIQGNEETADVLAALKKAYEGE